MDWVQRTLATAFAALRWLLIRGLPLVGLLLGSSALSAQPQLERPAPTAAHSMTGTSVRGMESYDRLIPAYMHKWHIPGGAVAVVKDGRLVLAKGYGWADIEAQEPVRPDSLFRIASISKPVMAAAILKLVADGRLELDAKVCTVLGQFPQGPHADQRWQKITVRHLLQHTGGWDPARSFDPMFRPYQAAEAVGAKPPASSTSIIRYMLGEPLQSEPGQHFAYSNFGYCLLGRVIEAKTGKGYEDAVRELVLTPCGIRQMRIGRTRLARQADGEVRYHHQPATELAKSVFPEAKEPVPWPYGGFYLESMDSHGGWIASATDLMRFVTAAEGSRQPPLLSSQQRAEMLARPSAPVSVDTPTYYGLGWSIKPTGDRPTRKRPTGDKGANWWHTGSLPGTCTILVRTSKGWCWAALFNSRPSDQEAKKLGDFRAELDELLWKAAAQVTRWPDHDLFHDQQP